MNGKYVLLSIAIIIILLIIVIYSRYNRKKYFINKIKAEYGDYPKEYISNSDDFDISLPKKYYESRKKAEGNFHSIDDLTWNDLDMDTVFKRVNYTDTTLGEGYLFYKLRKVEYNEEQWQHTEPQVNIFMKNEKLRNKLKYELLKVGKIKDDYFIHFIYNPTFIKIKSYYKYPLLSIAFIISSIISIIGIFLDINILKPSFIVLLCLNILVYQSVKNSLEDNFNTMKYIANNIALCVKLTKIKDSDFSIYREKCSKVLEDFPNIKKLLRNTRYLSKNKSGILSDIDIIFNYIKMFFMIDIIAYQNIANILEENKDTLFHIYDLIAELDFQLNLSYYRKSLDTYTLPEITKENNLELIDIYHPLLEDAVTNSITINSNILFTGSNASGKSTFIKSLALNCIFAQNLNTALCSKYKANIFKVVTSMAIKDDITSGNSYFIAEIKSLKRLLDCTDDNIPVLAFVDEILKGTNTIERISASASILNYVKNTNIRLLIATHDIELTQIISDGYENYHFRETVTDNDVTFDYKLRTGPSTTSNAIKLLSVMNFKDSIITDANVAYNNFIKNKKWMVL